MPKSRKRRKRNAPLRRMPHTKSVKRSNGGTKGPFLFRDPISEIPPNELRKGLVEVGIKSASDFETAKATILELCEEVDPFHLLTVLSISNMVGMADDGQKSREEEPGTLQQSHIELAQAIILSIPPARLGRKPAHSHQIQLAMDTLVRMAKLFKDMRFVALEKIKNDADGYEVVLVERLRVHTQFVRNWGHFKQVVEHVTCLYGGSEIRLSSGTDLKVAKVIEVFKFMIRQLEEDGTDHLIKFRRVLSRKSKRDMIRTYNAEIVGRVDETDDDFMSFVNEKGISRTILVGLLLDHSMYRRIDSMCFKYTKLADQINCTSDDIQELLEPLSYEFGDLKNCDFEHLFMGNPVWERPIITFSEESCFCPLPQLFFSFSIQILENLLIRNGWSENDIREKRTEYLEKQTTQLLKNAFPGCEISQNIKWILDGRRYETDILVRFASCLFIVEAKSGSVSAPALRGAIGRVKKHVEELLIAPAIQSSRLEAALRDRFLTNQINEKFEFTPPFTMDGLTRIERISVTLEDFATIQANISELMEGGIFKVDVPPTVTISLADLEAVLEILENPEERIFYLIRRNEIQSSVKYLADEMDLLGLYLGTGFSLGEFEQGEQGLNLFSMSQQIGTYFDALAQNIHAPKPKRKIPQWFRAVLRRLTSKRPNQWLEIATMLLRLSPNDQEEAVRQINRIRKRLKRHKTRQEDEQNTIAYIPPNWQSLGYAFVLFRENERHERHSIMQDATDGIFLNSRAQRCLVIAQDVAGNDYPYTTLAVQERPDHIPLEK